MSRYLKSSIPMLVLLGLLGFLSVTSRAANPNCGEAGTNNGRFFLGYTVQSKSSPPYMNEAEVHFDREANALCSNPSADSAFWWVMLAGNGCWRIADAARSGPCSPSS